MATYMEPSWPQETENVLVDMWAERPCLFAVSSADYSNRDMKDKAVKEIAIALQKTVADVKKKMSGLRNSYNRAKRPAPSGSKAKPLSKRGQWLLLNLSFIGAHAGERTSTSNLLILPNEEDNDSVEKIDEETEEDVFVSDDNSSANTSLSPRDKVAEPIVKSTKRPLGDVSCKKSVKRKREEEEMNILKSLARSLDSDEKPTPSNSLTVSDSCTAFGTHVANSLQQLDLFNRTIVMNEIQSALTKAMVNQLQRHDPPPDQSVRVVYDSQSQSSENYMSMLSL